MRMWLMNSSLCEQACKKRTNGNSNDNPGHYKGTLLLSYDGKISWFSYEDAIDDWCDIIELEDEKKGPALRNRLEGDQKEKQLYISVFQTEMH